MANYEEGTVNFITQEKDGSWNEFSLDINSIQDNFIEEFQNNNQSFNAFEEENDKYNIPEDYEEIDLVDGSAYGKVYADISSLNDSQINKLEESIADIGNYFDNVTYEELDEEEQQGRNDLWENLNKDN